MVPIEKGKDQPTLEEVQELFDVWRKEKKRRDPIPPVLWESAVSLVEQRSINTVAKHLRLNYNELKIRAKGYPTVPARKERSPAFIELALSANPVTEYTIEMEKPTGERMRIRGACNVTELVRQFFR